MSKLRDLVGRRARLVATIETRGGDRYPRGTEVVIVGVWRGRFTLGATEDPKPGYARRVLMRHINRDAVKVIA